MLQTYLKTDKGLLTNKQNVTNISNHVINNTQDNPQKWQQRVYRNRQLLLMLHKLQQVSQSIIGRCLQFQKSQLFLSFQHKYRFKQILRLRIDDIVYIALLSVICFVFGVLLSNIPEPNTIATSLIKSYRYMLVFLVLFSIIWLISTNGYRHWVFAMICCLFPILTILLYMRILPFGDDIDTTITLFDYLHILTLLIVYVALYIIYPIKQFVRNKIGSLYSYLYALSTITLLFIWPSYSLLQEFINNNGNITFTFITQNKPLIITFLVIIVFTFHLLTHNTFFQGNMLETKMLLLREFKLGELAQALQEVELEYREELGQDIALAPEEGHNNTITQFNNTNSNINNITSPTKKHPKFRISQFQKFLFRNFTAYTRTMSLLVFAFTMAIQIFVFLYLADNLSYIYRCLAIMIFCVGFLIYGCIINLIPISRQLTLYLFSIVSLVPAGFSPVYVTSFSFYEYIFLAAMLPYTTIFWCVVRSLSKHRPFLKTNMLVILYIFVHIPLTLFILNQLSMISTNAQTIYIFNIVVLSVVGLVTVVGLLGFILWLVLSIKQLPKQQKQQNKIVNYNYFEEGNPPYVPYIKKQSFSLSWLSSLDIRNLAQIFNCILFIVLQLITMYIFNQLHTTLSNTVIVSQHTAYIIYAQFYITFAYFSYAFSYIVFKYNSNVNILILAVFAMLGIFGIAFSYLTTISIAYSFRIAGATSAAICMIGIGLQIVKKNNKQIINFVSGIIIILIWIFLILPYAILLPIVVIYIDIAQYGLFIYACILATTILLILLVSILSIVFNVLMNKFQEQKKAKFMTQDVQTYLKQQGIQTQDQVLHILYQSYQYRDQRYVYFMKKGYPIRLYKDPQDNDSNYKTIVYNAQNINKQSMEDIKQIQKSKDYCWLCLTCLCGVDQSQLQNKMKNVSDKNIIDQDQMEQLMPQQFFKEMFIKVIRKQQKKQRKYVDMSKLYSSKSIILRHLTKKNRHMGQQYAILKTKKNKNLGNQIYHLIFQFLANQDDPPLKIIFNDFLIFCSIIDVDIPKNIVNDIFLDYSTQTWKNNTAIDINDFSLVVEQIIQKVYTNIPPHQENKYIFLIEHVYPKLCEYSQFQDIVNQRRIKKTKQVNNNNNSSIAPGMDFTQNYSTIKTGQLMSGFADKIRSTLNVFTMSSQELQNSPFVTSYERHKRLNQKLGQKRQKLQQKKLLNMKDKLIQPAKQQIILPKIKKQPMEKTKSCKLIIYEKYQACKNCCSTIQQQQAVIKRKNIKPWEFLAVESIRIMQHKQSQWKQQRKQKQYQFRFILNNLLIAVFKLADLYTYMQITIMNPQAGWQSLKSFSVLLIQYRIQLYISFGLVLVCAGLGIKGITYIFQDRLGLTQTRIPAIFPHPMFFFTFIYKLLILSFFNTIIMTLLSTFMCDWVSSSSASSFNMILSSTDTPLVCFSAQHNIYIICSLIAIILYYPLSAYTMPNFQFAEKRLDLKYKPSYLIIYFQVNFVLAAGKVLLSQVTSTTTTATSSTTQSIQIIFQSINIFCIGLLGLMVIWMKPCLIGWFNVIQFLVIWVGFVWNVFGLVLYLTGYWLMAIIASSAISVASIILAIVYIRRRFYGAAKVQMQANQDQIGQLQLGWKYRKQYNVDMARFQHKRAAKSKNIQNKQKQRSSQQQISQKQFNNKLNKGKDKDKKNNNTGDIDEARTNIGSHKKIKAPILDILNMEASPQV